MFSRFHDLQFHVNGPDDYIYLRNLHLSAIIGKDAWDRDGKPQPVLLSIWIQRDITQPGESDDINETVSYGQMCKDVMSYVAANQEYRNLYEFVFKVHSIAFTKKWGGVALYMRVTLPKASLRAEGGLALEAACTMDEDAHLISERFIVKDLKLTCIIGVNVHERFTKQTVIINLEITDDRSGSSFRTGVLVEPGETQRKELIKDVITVCVPHLPKRPKGFGLIPLPIKTVERSSYETLEALAAEIARVSFGGRPIKRVKVSVEKPSALAFVDGAGVQLTRTFSKEVMEE
ncbi:trifunctional dihydropteroate synthetase [Ptychographa xylographoides]|nr:trifunctional dihydropteroate synthetase [Ptychographa xylographoides]